MHLLAAIDWSSLGESVAVSLVAGVGIVLAFAIGLRCLIQAAVLRADGRTLSATVAATIGALGLGIAIVATVAGLVLVAGDGPAG